LTVSTEASFAGSLKVVRDGLREHGLVEGQDVVIDVRYGNGRTQILSSLAAELAGLRPAVIIALGAAATDAALSTGGDVPIVSLGDLVARGYATDLGRPASRVTGISFLPAPLNVKRLELLAELLPKGSAILNLADLRPLPGAMQAVEDAGRALGLVTHAAYANTPAEIESAFLTARKLRVAGVNVLNSPFLSAESATIIRLAANARLPAIYQWPETAREGGLIGYGPSITAMFRQLADYASRILNGAKPTELPIEQPKRFELCINLKTAKALGLAIPQSLLVRADEVIR
jgi:putative ABC transport system substrate-binding protein